MATNSKFSSLAVLKERRDQGALHAISAADDTYFDAIVRAGNRAIARALHATVLAATAAELVLKKSLRLLSLPSMNDSSLINLS